MDSKRTITLFVLTLVTFVTSSVIDKKRQILDREPGSQVEINVGEDSFSYNVIGQTRSYDRISVSGYYFNQERPRRGDTYLYLGVEYGIDYYEYDYSNYNQMLVRIFNYNQNIFFYTISVPRGVSAYRHLRIKPHNQTAVEVRAPSRSTCCY